MRVIHFLLAAAQLALNIHDTSFSISSTSIQNKSFPVSVVTVTDRTTVTETSCSASSISTKPLETILPTSLVADDIVKSTVPAITSITSLIPAVNSPGTTSLSSAFENEQTSQSNVVIITKTAWSTTWTSITAQSSAPVSTSAEERHSSVDKDLNDQKYQQPIDQVHAGPTSSPMITSIKSVAPVLAAPTTSCTSNDTASVGVVGKTSTSLEVSSLIPTVHTGLPVFGNTGTRIPKVTQFPHPTPKIPIIPKLPFGHQPLFSNGTLIRNHTTLSFYHEKPTVHPGTASISKHHIPVSSTSIQAAKCTTAFPHSPTHACTSTSYAHTKTIAVNCYGCVGEQAKVTKQTYHEEKVCLNSVTATVTLPTSRKTVCSGPLVATGGSAHSKGKPSSTHVASSGFVTSTSASGFHGSGYGHGNWTGRG